MTDGKPVVALLRYLCTAGRNAIAAMEHGGKKDVCVHKNERVEREEKQWSVKKKAMTEKRDRSEPHRK